MTSIVDLARIIPVTFDYIPRLKDVMNSLQMFPFSLFLFQPLLNFPDSSIDPACNDQHSTHPANNSSQKSTECIPSFFALDNSHRRNIVHEEYSRNSSSRMNCTCVFWIFAACKWTSMRCSRILISMQGLFRFGKVVICCSDTFQEVQVIETCYVLVSSRKKGSTIVCVLFGALKRITPFCCFYSDVLNVWSYTEIVYNVSWIVLADTILLNEVFRLESARHKELRYSIMNMHIIHSKASSWSDVEIARYFINRNISSQITSFMTLTHDILLITTGQLNSIVENTVLEHIVQQH